jgi:hypothetical protein
MKAIPAALLAGAFACACASASAQDAAPSYDGTWAATYSNAGGREFGAELVLKGDSGTWRNFAGRGDAMLAKNNPCLMRDFPVTVRKSTADELTFFVEGSKAVAGCKDFTATLKRVDADTLDGTFGGAWKVHVARK